MEEIKNDEKNLILIIEDAKDFQFLLKRLLTNNGYRTSSAENGQEALDFLRTTRELPALILLDLMMPIMDGYQFREEQRKEPRLAQIPVVVLSAHGHIDIKSKSLHVNDFLRKPADMNLLLETARKFCKPIATPANHPTE